ncbi:MAG: 2-succinyl-5-enolpyruvyl-6-hydroxy-3-cyclohexene-1-carboxylic-acid synthase [Chryseolinea sp.]
MKARLQPIYDIAALCAAKGLTQAVLCPGSRNAPLILAFTRQPLITCKTISDERSAAFIALGIAQHTALPTLLVCTSGSAAYNFAPAIAEAFFSHTPLLVLTADRPNEWIAQQDGQTIYQEGIFGRHVKGSYHLTQEYVHLDSEWGINRTINEAINLSLQEPAGPVHVNIPFREPLYPDNEQVITSTQEVRVMANHAAHHVLTEEQKVMLTTQWPSFHRILLVAGQQESNESRVQATSHLIRHHNIPLVADILSNLHGIDGKISHADIFLGAASEEVKKTLQPDLLITFGDSVISKNLKLFLRNFPASVHWHIQSAGLVADTYKSITKIFQIAPNAFFNFLSGISRIEGFESQRQDNFAKLWEVEERRAQRTMGEFFPMKELAELEVVNEVMLNLPADCNLHLANSMSVRYANYIGLHESQAAVHVYCNRGTSGIDGCTSTAMGHALASNIPNILITGDMAFFYDRNAFWHNHEVNNLRIVLLNNHGGVIFKMIDGPGELPEADEYFVTNQKLNARKLCEEYGFEYLKLDTKRKMKNLLIDFMEPGPTIKIMEIESSITLNKGIFDALKLTIKKSYE